MTKELSIELDKICTALYAGVAWHNRAANECREVAFRGGGRWHEDEALDDIKHVQELEKLLCDRQQYKCEIDGQEVARSFVYNFADMDALKEHFNDWVTRENKFVPILNNAIKMSMPIDICIYKKLICICDEVQNEIMRVSLCEKRLEMAGWNRHDIGIVSMLIHDFYEKGGSSKDMNVNLG